MISTVEETGVTETFDGLCRMVAASLTISAGMVAEKKSDCFCFGSTVNNFLIS